MSAIPMNDFPFRQNLSRREVLRVGAIGMGLSLPQLLAAEQERREGSATAARADACIVILLNGGPSHLDMWDMKPTGPTDSRGQFKPIASSVPGVQVCEHLPKLSRQMHRCTLIRSMHHSVNNAHAAAVYVALTGHDRGEIGGGFRPSDNPPPGAVLARLRPTAPHVVPHVALPYMTKEGAKGPPQPGFFGGWMGREFDPLWILRDPSRADFSVPEFTLRRGVSAERLARRGRLLTELNARVVDRSSNLIESMTKFQLQARDLLTSSTTQQAFQIDQEKSTVRDAYGRNIYGQSVLLARRLIEAGTRMVTVSWAPDANATWDTHSGNFVKLKNTLLPQFDSATSTLLADLADRGMLERTLVAVVGDFGRTPKINKNNAGRDHWNFCYTILLAGGGIRPGMVRGASDKAGAFPADAPTTPADVLATQYHLLGVDHRRSLYDRFDRPHQIVTRGDVIDSILT